MIECYLFSNAKPPDRCFFVVVLLLLLFCYYFGVDLSYIEYEVVRLDTMHTNALNTNF